MGKKRNRKRRLRREGVTAVKQESFTAPEAISEAKQESASDKKIDPATRVIENKPRHGRVMRGPERTPDEIKEAAQAVLGSYGSANVRGYTVSRSGLPDVTNREIPSRYTKAVAAGVPMPEPSKRRNFQRPEPYKPPEVDSHWANRKPVDIENVGKGWTWGPFFSIIKGIRRLYNFAAEKLFP